VPLIRKLAKAGAAISIDTRKASVMEGALQAGATMINDISALLYDERALEVARNSNAPVVLMHAPSQGADPHKDGTYDEVVYDVFDWLEQRVSEVEAAGMARDKILVDPGIGFGKTLADNLAIINNLAIYHGLGCALLFGASRKRLIGALSNAEDAKDRLGGSIFLAMRAVEQGAHIVRVHDAAETVQAIQVWRGLRDAAGVELR
jgi:dihydropteroate synthase